MDLITVVLLSSVIVLIKNAYLEKILEKYIIRV
jgi:hypothetical protein